MPSHKIISVSIICIGIITSVWLFSKKSNVSTETAGLRNTESVSVDSIIKIGGEGNDDWKKMLTAVDQKSQKLVDLTKNISEEDDTTLTDQMARDFLSQYLLTVKSGVPVTSETASLIAQNTLSLPEYSRSGVTYIKSNLKTTLKKDVETIQKYKLNINNALKPVYYDVNTDTVSLIMDALQSENENELKKLDPIIAINRKVVKDLLAMEVPENAVKTHLALLNASSNILSDLEAIRVTLGDPVKGLTVLGQYPTHLDNFAIAVINMDLFLLKDSLI